MNGAVHGMRIGRGNRSTQRKPLLLPLCPPQFSYDLTWYQTLATAVGSSQLTVFTLAQPVYRKSVCYYGRVICIQKIYVPNHTTPVLCTY
jgi:hypothetical protein